MRSGLVPGLIQYYSKIMNPITREHHDVDMELYGDDWEWFIDMFNETCRSEWEIYMEYGRCGGKMWIGDWRLGYV